MQYMRVVQAGGGQQQQQQVINLRGATPILPSTAAAAPASKARAKSTLSGVKISVPPGGLAKGANVTLAGNYKVYQNRVLLPQGESLNVKQEPTDAKPVITANAINETNIAYEAFLNRGAKDHGRSSGDEPLGGDGDAASVGAASADSMNNAGPFEPSGVRPRKPCNCTKSQCLKLYCDCFANGEFCFNCNCNNCFNNLQHEEERQKAIKQCLDRNPNAFKPKIGRLANDGERRHNKGCNCKRSGCLKNYCECYEAKIPCTDACKCIGCKNVEEETGRKKELKDRPPVEMKPSLKAKLAQSLNGRHATSSGAAGGNSAIRQPFSFITPDVVEASCQCMLAQAEESERRGVSEADTESMIIEEFGRCLAQIIDMGNRTRSFGGGVHS